MVTPSALAQAHYTSFGANALPVDPYRIARSLGWQVLLTAQVDCIDVDRVERVIALPARHIDELRLRGECAVGLGKTFFDNDEDAKEYAAALLIPDDVYGLLADPVSAQRELWVPDEFIYVRTQHTAVK